MPITTATGGTVAYLHRRTSTTATFSYAPPAGFDSGLAVAVRSNGARIILSLSSAGTFTMTGLSPGTYMVYVAGTDATNTNVMVTPQIKYEHPATVIADGDGFAIEYRTDYNDEWQGDEYDEATIRERIVTNATAHWLQWRISGNEQDQRIVLRNTQAEVRLLGMAQAASEA